MPTADGDVWFKENAPASAFEPALTVAVARRRSEHAPEVLAIEGPRILTRDVGPQLREVRNAGASDPAWNDVLRLHGQLQVELMSDVEEALAAGILDLRLERLPELYDELIERLGLGEFAAAGVSVRRACDALSGTLPATIAHLEATEGNIFVRDDGPVFIDWAEACVAHPFVASVLPLRDASERGGFVPGSPDVERLRDAYLEPFVGYTSLAKLREVFPHGYLLGTVCKALSWDATLAPLPHSVREELGDPIHGWLEILHELENGTTTLGGA